MVRPHRGMSRSLGKEGIPTPATTWMDPEDAVLSEVIPVPRDRFCMSGSAPEAPEDSEPQTWGQGGVGLREGTASPGDSLVWEDEGILGTAAQLNALMPGPRPQEQVR